MREKSEKEAYSKIISCFLEWNPRCHLNLHLGSIYEMPVFQQMNIYKGYTLSNNTFARLGQLIDVMLCYVYFHFDDDHTHR